jgi:hypothetical protein
MEALAPDPPLLDEHHFAPAKGKGNRGGSARRSATKNDDHVVP